MLNKANKLGLKRINTTITLGSKTGLTRAAEIEPTITRTRENKRSKLTDVPHAELD